MFEQVPIIHKQWPSAASAEKFIAKVQILSSDADRVVFKYDSPNRPCGVLRYVAEGVLAHYGEQGTVTETQCARQGARWCEIEVCFSPVTA